MHSIRKIGLTPVKWAFKKAIHKFLLEFPGGEHQPDVACVYCPEMCRFSCPVAVASGNDAVTPSNKMSLIPLSEQWPESDIANADQWPVYGCTGCGRCTEYCVYEMPVADRLFAARSSRPWKVAQSVLQSLTAEDDPYGEFAYECGQPEESRKRLRRFLEKPDESQSPVLVFEPKTLAYLIENKVKAELPWASDLNDDSFLSFLISTLKSCSDSTQWLVHESVWWSRRLRHFDTLKDFMARIQSSGLNVRLPFQNGLDCLDCGGEGIYRKFFPEVASEMAQQFWSWDSSRCQGILTFSERCESHLKSSLNEPVILSIPAIWRKWKS